MILLAMEEMQNIKQAAALAQPNDPPPGESGKKSRQRHGQKRTD
jgi:hypothetical protein